MQYLLYCGSKISYYLPYVDRCRANEEGCHQKINNERDGMMIVIFQDASVEGAVWLASIGETVFATPQICCGLFSRPFSFPRGE